MTILQLPLMLEASQVNSYFKINSAGVATIRCEVYGNVEETNRVRISAELQQYKNGEWVTIKTFVKDSATYYASLSKIHSVTKGYDFRLNTVFKTYSESAIGTRIVTSDVVKY